MTDGVRMSPTDSSRAFQGLLDAAGWPAEPPVPEAPVVGRSSTGLELLVEAVRERTSTPVIMEIGAEFGGSSRRFLEALPECRVISVDPWPDTYRGGSFPEIRPYLGAPGAMLDLFQTFCFAHRDRLAPVRAFSPAGVVQVFQAGVEVDLVYIDGDHRYDAVVRDMTIADALFPGALLGGDDWELASHAKKYQGMKHPVREAVTAWAAFRDVHVETRGDTWLIDRERPFNQSRPVRSGGYEDVVRRLDQLDHRVADIQKQVRAPSFAERVVRKVRSTWRR